MWQFYQLQTRVTQTRSTLPPNRVYLRECLLSVDPPRVTFSVDRPNNGVDDCHRLQRRRLPFQLKPSLPFIIMYHFVTHKTIYIILCDRVAGFSNYILFSPIYFYQYSIWRPLFCVCLSQITVNGTITAVGEQNKKLRYEFGQIFLEQSILQLLLCRLSWIKYELCLRMRCYRGKWQEAACNWGGGNMGLLN